MDTGAKRGQRHQISLELEIQAVAKRPDLGAGHQTLIYCEQYTFLTIRPSLQSLFYFKDLFLIKCVFV